LQQPPPALHLPPTPTEPALRPHRPRQSRPHRATHAGPHRGPCFAASRGLYQGACGPLSDTGTIVGIKDFFSSAGRSKSKLDKHIKAVQNQYAQSADRYYAMEQLLEIGEIPAIVGLMKRFTMNAS